MMSKIGLGQVSHLGSTMTACVSCLRTVHERQHVSLKKLWEYHNQTWLCSWGHLDLCPGCPIGYSTSWPKRRASAVLKPLFRHCRSGVPRSASDLLALVIRSGSVRQYSEQIVVVPGRWTYENDSQAWAPSRKGHAVSVVGQQGRVPVWTFATQHKHHCAALMPATRSNGQSDLKQAPEAWPHPLPSPQRQAPRRKTSSGRRGLSWTGKCSSPHRTV